MPQSAEYGFPYWITPFVPGQSGPFGQRLQLPGAASGHNQKVCCKDKLLQACYMDELNEATDEHGYPQFIRVHLCPIRGSFWFLFDLRPQPKSMLQKTSLYELASQRLDGNAVCERPKGPGVSSELAWHLRSG